MGPKTFCKYCHGVTFDDNYGNCIACGAPRIQPEVTPIKPTFMGHEVVIRDYQVQAMSTEISTYDDPEPNWMRRLRLWNTYGE